MSQVNFFMLSSDEDAFVDYLDERGDTKVHLSPGVIVPVRQALAGRSDLVLINTGMPLEGNSPKLFEAPFIDFPQSLLAPDLLVSGRLFAKIGWLPSPEENKKFESWYRSITRHIKTRYRNVDGWWVGPAAEEWSLRGGLLAFGHRKAMKRSLSTGG